MTEEEIIRMARDISNTPHDAHTTPDLFGVNQIVRFFHMAQAAEREACAKVVDAAKADEEDWDSNDWNQAVEFCANRIRARGQNT